MLINFCNDGLIKSITCSVGECDGYSVNNLVRKREVVNQSGFIADYFIKPPVTINIEFVCKICVNHIVVHPRVGNQMSTGLEVFTSENCGDNFVAKAFLKNEIGFFFHVNGDKETAETAPNNFLLQTFKSSRYLNVNQLKINIIKTLNSTVPALKKLEIWGKISRGCTASLKKDILDKWSDLQKPHIFGSHLHRSKNSVIDVKEQILSNAKILPVIIPDDFLDPITYELMDLPMILPCGKAVDWKTLQKYNTEQEKYGRAANDPFTGKVFTDISKPLLCTPLKLRIDKFLLDNSDDVNLRNVPRSTGLPTSEEKVSSIVLDCKGKLNCVNDKMDCNNQINLSSSDRVSVSGTAEPLSVECRSSENVKNFSIDINSIDALKDSSLDAAIKASVSSTQKRSHPYLPRQLCSDCNKTKDLYILPCKHYTCKNCISGRLKSFSAKCGECGLVFKSSDVTKTHTSHFFYSCI